MARIGGSLHVLNVADHVLSRQLPTDAKNAIVQGPISGLDHSSTITKNNSVLYLGSMFKR
jgi:hypothetical protein